MVVMAPLPVAMTCSRRGGGIAGRGDDGGDVGDVYPSMLSETVDEAGNTVFDPTMAVLMAPPHDGTM